MAEKAIAGRFGPELHKNLAFLEGELSQSRFFAGDSLTAADIQIGFVLEFVEVLGPLKDQYPKIAAFLETIKERPAYQKALERGGRYNLDDFKPVLR